MGDKISPNCEKLPAPKMTLGTMGKFLYPVLSVVFNAFSLKLLSVFIIVQILQNVLETVHLQMAVDPFLGHHFMGPCGMEGNVDGLCADIQDRQNVRFQG